MLAKFSYILRENAPKILSFPDDKKLKTTVWPKRFKVEELKNLYY
jgi:hypothetical protein